jgi:hypothetical protein
MAAGTTNLALRNAGQIMLLSIDCQCCHIEMQGNEELLPSVVNAHVLLQTAHEFSSWPACSATQITGLPFAFPSPMLFRLDKQRENGALLIAACIVAAIRLRGEPIQRSQS